MIATTIKQSKKLLGLGINPDTADMLYIKREINDTFIETPIVRPNGELLNSLPAWSLSALVDLMPKNVEIERTHIGWRCDYYSNNDSLLKYGKDKNTLFDAAFEMIEWLCQEGYIKTKETEK